MLLQEQEPLVLASKTVLDFYKAQQPNLDEIIQIQAESQNVNLNSERNFPLTNEEEMEDFL